MSDPSLGEEDRAASVHDLMDARRSVGTALRAKDTEAETAARQAVDAAKRKLGERGPVWWDDGAPDFNRRMVATTPYADWFATLDKPVPKPDGG